MGVEVNLGLADGGNFKARAGPTARFSFVWGPRNGRSPGLGLALCEYSSLYVSKVRKVRILIYWGQLLELGCGVDTHR